MKNNIEKEIDKIWDKYRGFESLSESDVIEICKHFYEYGKSCIKSSMIDGWTEGNSYFKQMWVRSDCFSKEMFDTFNYGDKVKVIVLKENE